MNNKIKHTPGLWVLSSKEDTLIIKMGTALNNTPGYDLQHQIEWEHGLDPGCPAEKKQLLEAIANFKLMSNSPRLFSTVKMLRNLLAELPTHDGKPSPYVKMADDLIAEIEGDVE